MPLPNTTCSSWHIENYNIKTITYLVLKYRPLKPNGRGADVTKVLRYEKGFSW